MSRSRYAVGLAVAIALAGSGTVAAQTNPVPTHLVWAEKLVSEVAPANNQYNWSPTYVVWSEDGNGVARNRSVCSSFVTHDLMRAYGLTRADILRRFGLTNPQAKDYYDTLAAQRGFTLVSNVADIQPGDIIAVAYPPGSRPTGHVMLFDGVPRAHRATKPLVPGTRQYEIAVIDSSASYHGFKDTRYVEGGRHGSGVGRGTLRLYANLDGTIAGYAWSTRSNSVYYPANVHRVVVGRYSTAPFAPAPAVGNGTGESGDCSSPEANL